MNVLFICIIFLGLHSCKKLIPKGIFPYDMSQFEPGVFIDRTEITVEQYAEFVFDGNEIHRPNQKLTKEFRYHELFYPTQSPDSLYRALGKIDYYQLPVVFEYFDTLNYIQLRDILDFPITGISYDDAEAYTSWRTDKYNQLQTDHTKKKIKFSLPSSLDIDEEKPVNSEIYSEKNIYIVRSEKHAKKTVKNIYGLNSNARELTANSQERSPNSLTSFRCIGTVIEK